MLLVSLAYLLLTVSAASVPSQARANVPDAEIQDLMGDGTTGATSDLSAGIGAEFETPEIMLKNAKCSKADTDDFKKSVIAGRKDPGGLWALTADTTSKAGLLHLEYIMDGKNIKVGSGKAKNAGKEAAADFAAWSPWDGTDTSKIKVGAGKCDPWAIDGATKGKTKAASVNWMAQVTAPMPLEGLYSLMLEQAKDLDIAERNILSGAETKRTGKSGSANLVLATKSYFQSKPQGIEQTKVTNDMLGFVSLVLSYAKGAQYLLQSDESPKLMTTFMPRTEFNTIFKQVKSKFSGDLFKLFEVLACYKSKVSKKADGTYTVTVGLDKDFCTGTTAAPVPIKDKFAGLEFKNAKKSINIKTWITGIGAGTGSVDGLSEFDTSIDGSIGGLKTATEHVYNTQRAVPLFEFRDLVHYPTTSEFESFMSQADQTIQELHKKFATAPS
ncbi:hypothetical protein N0V93_008855 [Gnomoniopsis smithogilvyi]|uniref:Uncharacterized protein n=1 Tax=Gnomoniopsis smithogilvyi TaxID=1191159 RepID=A0A9W9CT83_9PEZI|nr:hypothetical protein N0V93_008855 [Gnomoniopsis smithogilvyi]